jgi:hypothetical protein
MQRPQWSITVVAIGAIIMTPAGIRLVTVAANTMAKVIIDTDFECIGRLTPADPRSTHLNWGANREAT